MYLLSPLPMFKVLCTRQIPEKGIELLKNEGVHVEIWTHPTPMSSEELYERAKDKDAVISTIIDQIDASFFDACPQVKIVANYGTHCDNMDIGEASKRKVALTYTPRVYVEAVAEHTIGLMLALARHTFLGTQYMKDGSFKRWDPLLMRGMELRGKTLGLIGFGSVGQRVAHIANHGFGMHVVYADYEEVKNTAHARYVTLDELCQLSEVISIHVPNRPTTKGMINSELMRKMKDKVLIINTSRGIVVDEQALVQNLRGGKIGGAALDVLSCDTLHNCEPEDHSELKKLHNVILTPQIASSTFEARDSMSELVAQDILAVLHGKRPESLINPEIYEE